MQLTLARDQMIDAHLSFGVTAAAADRQIRVLQMVRASASFGSSDRVAANRVGRGGGGALIVASSPSSATTKVAAHRAATAAAAALADSSPHVAAAVAAAARSHSLEHSAVNSPSSSSSSNSHVGGTDRLCLRQSAQASNLIKSKRSLVYL